MTDASLLDHPGAADWRAAVARVLKGGDPETLVSRTQDGLAIEPLYAAADAPDTRPWRDAGQPIAIVQRVDHPDPVEAGRMAAADVANGAAGLTLVFAGAGTSRSFGLSTEEPDTVSTVLDWLGAAPFALRCEFPPNAGEALVDRVLAGAERLSIGAMGRVDLAADPLGDAARTGHLPGAPNGTSGGKALAEAADRWVRLLRVHGVAGPALRVDGRPHHEAGASESQELAAVLSTGVFYLRALDRAGLAGDALTFTLAADTDHMLTLSKFRALRRLWARVEEACGLAPTPIRVHAETAWRMLSRRDAWTNMLRNTIACTGALLGGADSVTVLPFTSALGLPDAFARRLARNTPIVLLAEANLGRVADPSAGSGAFEGLTEALCCEAWRQFQALEAGGGLATALESGAWHAQVAATREARLADLRAGTTRLVGVTAFAPSHDTVPAVLMRARPEESQAAVGASPRFPPLPSIRDAEPFEVDAAGETEP